MKLLYMGRPGDDIGEFAKEAAAAIFAESSDPNIFIPKHDDEMVKESGATVQEEPAKAKTDQEKQKSKK